MRVKNKAASTTRDKLLWAAERCFTEYGFEGTSLRRITRLAGVNLAAVNYHFSSKTELWLEMMQRRLAPLNTERLRMLEVLRAATPRGEPLPMEKICEAMILPIARNSEARGTSSLVVARMVARVFSEPTHLRKELNRRTLVPVWRAFLAAIRDAMPGASQAEVDWKFYFMLSAMLGALAWQGQQTGFDHPVDTGDLEAMLRRLIAFAGCGLKAPSPAEK